MIHRDHPDTWYAVVERSPLIIGKKKAMPSSLPMPMPWSAGTPVKSCTWPIPEIDMIKTNQINVYDASRDAVQRETKILSNEIGDATKKLVMSIIRSRRNK